MTLLDCIFVGLLRSWSKKTTNSSGVLSNCSSRTNAHLILSHFIQSQPTVWTAQWLFNRLNEHILLVLGQYKVTVQEHTYWTPTYATDKSFCKCNQDPMEIPVDPGIKFLKSTSVIFLNQRATYPMPSEPVHFTVVTHDRMNHPQIFYPVVNDPVFTPPLPCCIAHFAFPIWANVSFRRSLSLAISLALLLFVSLSHALGERTVMHNNTRIRSREERQNRSVPQCWSPLPSTAWWVCFCDLHISPSLILSHSSGIKIKTGRHIRSQQHTSEIQNKKQTHMGEGWRD